MEKEFLNINYKSKLNDYSGKTDISASPGYTIVGGVLAKPLRKRFPGPVIDSLFEKKWWDWPEDKIDQHIRAIQSGHIDQLPGPVKTVS